MMKKFEKNKKEMVCCVESHSESYSEDEFYPEWYVPQNGQEHIKKFLQNKKKNPKKIQKIKLNYSSSKSDIS